MSSIKIQVNKVNKVNEDNELIKIKNNNDVNISLKLVEQRNERQEYNNNIAYDEIKKNSENPNLNNINQKALERLLSYTNYKNLDEIIKDKNNYETNILKIASLYIAKNATRQGVKDEDLQLENINILQEYKVSIIRDGKQKPIKGGGIRKSGKKQADELKSIDFIINYEDNNIGYITAKVTSGNGGHQDNVLDEITQFCDWSQIQLQNDTKKIYVVLYDSLNTSKLYYDIQKKYKNDNILFTDTKKFKIDFLNWFNKK
jgi:hypothetical protein